MPTTDEQCVRSCLDGQPEAFRHLVMRYQTPLLRHLRFHIGDMDEAAEAAQETFVRAYFALRELRKPEAFFSWLFGIADRVAREAQRAAMRRRTVDLEKIEPVDLSTEQDSGRHNAITAVTEAVAKLPDAYRQVILLRFYGRQSCVEISRHLGEPLGTITKRLSRAYALLRESLDRGCHDHGDCPNFRTNENGTVPFGPGQGEVIL